MEETPLPVISGKAGNRPLPDFYAYGCSERMLNLRIFALLGIGETHLKVHFVLVLAGVASRHFDRSTVYLCFPRMVSLCWCMVCILYGYEPSDAERNAETYAS